MAYSNVPIGTSNPTCLCHLGRPILVNEPRLEAPALRRQRRASRAVNRVLKELVLGLSSG